MKLAASDLLVLFGLNAHLAVGAPSTKPLPRRIAPYPASINCGPDGGTSGLVNVGPPALDDLKKAANRMGVGTPCTTPAGSGKCIRVACDNTTGIWMCNTNGHDGPYTADSGDVKALVYRGEEEGGDERNDIFEQCKNVGLYSDNLVSGQAFDQSGDWNVISGYANCNISPLIGPDHQG